jgi:acetyltransferase-like isoleucine patch superfamily enzyme
MAFNPFGVALRSSTALRLLRNRFLFPGLRMAASVAQQIEGRVLYGTGCSIGQSSIMIVPPSATLRLGDGVYVGRNVELGAQDTIDIGDSTSIQDRSLLVGEVRIGRYCTLSLNVLITSGRHYYDLVPQWLIRDQDTYALTDHELSKNHHRPVRVEDDCWLGVNTVIMPGVTVGKGCVVGANSVVTRDLPPFSVAVGAPARMVKMRLRFSPPRVLDALSELDLPYFYSGFGVSAQERETGKSKGGLLARSDFSVALDVAGCREVSIAACSSGGACVLHFGADELPLSEGFTIATFPLDPEVCSPLSFSVVSSKQFKWPVCVSKVSVN